MGMDIVDTILANRRANRIIEAVDRSEYWQSNYEALLDKYNALARKYDHDIAEGHAEFEVVANVLREHIDSLPITKEEVNEQIQSAREKVDQTYPLS